MLPLGQSRRQQPFCLKFLYTAGFENVSKDEEENREEKAAKDRQDSEKM